PMSPETKKKVDQGIDTIFEKVELTTAKAKDLEQPQAEPTTESQPPVLAQQQPQYIGQTRAKMPSPTPKSKGGGKTTTKPTPTPTPPAAPTATPSGGTTLEKPKDTGTPATTEEKPKAPVGKPSYPYTKEIDCGTITISIGDSGELV